MTRKSDVRPTRRSAPRRTTAVKAAAPARKGAARKPLAGKRVAGKALGRKSAPGKPRRVRGAAPADTRPGSPPVEQVLEQLNRRYYDAFQSLDVEQVARLWWHDDAAGCIHPGWDARHGWPAVRESFLEIFSNTKSIRFALGDVRVRAVGDVGLVTCVENLVSEEGEAGDYLGAVLASNLFERRHGEWRLIHHHASPFSSDEAELPEGPLH